MLTPRSIDASIDLARRVNLARVDQSHCAEFVTAALKGVNLKILNNELDCLFVQLSTLNVFK